MLVTADWKALEEMVAPEMVVTPSRVLSLPLYWLV